MMTPLDDNARDLEKELAWFSRVLDVRFKQYFGTTEGNAGSLSDISDIAPPDLSASKSHYATFLREHDVDLEDRVLIVLALTSYIRPQMLDMFTVKNPTFDRPFAELGGVRAGAEGDFVPTGETLAFVLGGSRLSERFRVERRLSSHVFRKHGILLLSAGSGEPLLRVPLRLSEEWLALCTMGEAWRPDFGPGFPAKYITTGVEWDDIVLHPGIRTQLEDLEMWLEHGDTLMRAWGMATKLRPGYRALFHGPPGVGKTMTACLLGKTTGRDVYKIDLSLVVSKYIGETEKNLGRIFDQAQHKHWILFFDEADALFGKRSETKDAHDRFANQEISYLLQRIESFDGVAILASNRRDNLDEAFTRRFESIIYFPMPRPDERLRIWQQGFSSQCVLEPSIDLEKVADEYELSGGSIMNVVRYASLRALKHGGNVIRAEDLEQGIRREYIKERKG